VERQGSAWCAEKDVVQGACSEARDPAAALGGAERVGIGSGFCEVPTPTPGVFAQECGSAWKETGWLRFR
jgi:hypothetical protein